MKYFAILLFTFVSINSLYSTTIKGKVFDFNEKTPLNKATIKLFKKADSTLIKGVFSDEKGNYSLEANLDNNGNYLTISFVGYDISSLEIPFSKEKEINLGESYLKTNSNGKEVEVTANKQVVEFSAGKKVFNVEQSAVSEGGNAIDVLRTLQAVNVDAEGNVTLRGNGNVNIMIDNKPISIMGNVNQVLQSIPSNLIEKVETITNPGSKYDAEGQSGIINIVLKKKRNDGFNGLVNSSVGNMDMYNSSTSMNYKLDNTNYFLNLDYGNNRHIRKLRVDTRFYNGNNLVSKVDKAGDQFNKSLSTGLKIGAEHSFDEFNNITISADYRYSNSKGFNPNLSIANSSINGDNINSYFTTHTKSDGPFEYGNIGLNYLHNFGEKGYDLSFDAYIFPTSFDLNSNVAINSTDSKGNSLVTNTPNIYKTKMSGTSQTYLLQSDFTYPISAESKFETGAKAYIEGIQSEYKFDRLDNLNQNFYKDELLSSRANHQDNVIAAYANYSDKLLGMDYQAGLRLENTSNKLFNFYQNGNDSANFTRNFTNLFPNISLSYSIDELNSLQLSYSRRINRPQAPMLNPYLDKTDSLYWRTGNPQLLPEFTNSFEFGLLKNTDIGLFNAELFYSHTNQLMNPRFRENVTSTIIIERPMNIGTSDSYGVSLNSNLSLLKEWSLNMELSAFQQETEGNFGNIAYKQSSFGWRSKIITNLMLPDYLMIQLYAEYNSPVVITQGSRFDFTMANIAIKKELFDRKLSATLNWVDFLNTARFGGNVVGDSFAADFYNQRNFNYVTLSLSYKLNNPTRPRAKKPIEGAPGFGNSEG